MLGAFILVSSIQISKTNEALERADTSNTITRESLDLSKRIAEASDESTEKNLLFTQKSLAIAESSLTVSKRAIEINKMSVATVNSPFIQITPSMGSYHGSEWYEYELMIRNVGNTPAFSANMVIVKEIARSDGTDKSLIESDSLRIVNLAPKDSIMMIDTLKIPDQNLYYRMAEQTHFVTLRGSMEYLDIFGYKYHIDFRYYYDIYLDRFRIPIIGNSYKKIN